jgi:hypothetical protein
MIEQHDRDQGDPSKRRDPRPVFVTEDGQIFESDGTPFNFPGLEPESVKQGLEDFEAGRYRPLKDIIAGRDTTRAEAR